MKRAKMFLTAFAVIATVGSALAVKANFFNQGSIYCANTCVATSRVDFRINPNGAATKPCGSTAGVENASYIWDQHNPDVCVQNALGKKYDVLAAGN